MTPVLIVLVAYAIGAIPFAYVVARRWAHVDVRQVGSGNVGATNVLRTAGPTLALVVLLLDAGKGALAVWLARRAGLSVWLVAAAGLAAILGHVYPVWLAFRGGKGVATTCGVFAVLAPRALLAAAVVFLLVVWITRFVSLAAMIGAVVLTVVAAVLHEPRATVIVASLSAAIVLARHRGNINRLRAGTEPTIGVRLRAH